jgi:hypothetical protein
MAAGLVLWLAQTPARADLRFPEPVADAGSVRTGAPLAHTFHFINTGPGTIEVTEARGSCGCLSPKLEKRVYAPGEEGDLVLEVNTLSQSAGGHSWRVYFNYREGNRLYQTTLRLGANVVTEITVQPAALTVFAEQAVGHEVLLTDQRPQPLAVSELRTSSPKLRSRIAGTYVDARGCRVCKIQLEVTEDYPEGRHEEVLDIHTDDPMYRDLRVPVTIVKRARQSVGVFPAQVDLSASAGQIVSKIVLVRDSDGRPVTVEQATADNPAILCQWAHGPGAMSTVRITVDPSRLDGKPLQATVQVKVSQPEAKTIALPVSFRNDQ